MTRGGAANELPEPGQRNVYSDLNTASALTAAANAVATHNASITTAMLGLGATEAPGRAALIDWLRGADIDGRERRRRRRPTRALRWATR